MTDKVIIDGVNVSECVYFKFDNKHECYLNKNKCGNTPYCYFKQLASKTEECEKLRKLNKTLIESKHRALDLVTSTISKYYKKEEQLQAEKQKVEDLEKEFINQNEVNHELGLEAFKYKQALEDIQTIAGQIDLIIMGGDKSSKDEWMWLYNKTVNQIIRLCKVINEPR